MTPPREGPQASARARSAVRVVFAMTAGEGVPGGIARANENVLRAIASLVAERDGRLRVLNFLEGPGSRPDWLPDRVEYRAYSGRKGAFAASLVASALRRPLFCFDHVSLALPLLPLSAAGLARTVIFAHGSEAWKRPRPTGVLSLRHATLCVANSEFTTKKIREHLRGVRVTACPLGLPPSFPLDAAGAAAVAPLELEAVDGQRRRLGDQCLLLVARMHPALGEEGQKGHRPLIRVLPRLLTAFPNVQLVFPGPGDDRGNIAAYARELGVGDSVFLPGRVTDEILRQLYDHAFAFVMPSLQEGFGLAYLEAMNSAKPCLGCHDQGAEDIIVHGETGLLVHDPNDDAELAAALTALLADPDDARRMGRAGRQRLRERFTAQHHQRRVAAALEPLLDGPAGRPAPSAVATSARRREA